MQRYKFFALLLMLAISVTGITSIAAAAERRQIRVGMECAFAPNNWQEYEPTATNVPIENLDGFYADGYDVQIARIIAEELDADLIIVKIAWSGLIEALNRGQIDMIIAGMADSTERRQSVLFSEPYRETEYAVMVVNGSKYENAASIQDFAGASMLGQRDTKLDSVIDQIEGVHHLVPVDTVPNQITRLVHGTCDAIVVNYENTPEYLAVYPNFKVIRFAPGKGFDLDFTGSCVGLRKTDTELLQHVNEIISKISPEERRLIFNTTLQHQPK